jgi:aminopeptidase N
LASTYLVIDKLKFIGHPALLLLITVSASAVRRERLIDTWQPKHYNVSITLNSQLTEITQAQTDIDIVALKRLSLIDFDFGDLGVSSVTLNGNSVSYNHRNGKLEVTLPQIVNAGTSLRITVTYSGKPKDGLLFAADKDGKPAVVGDNWPNKVHHWIPSLDHPSAKATITFNITAPNNNLVVANGRFVKAEDTSSGMKTWTYTEGVPIPPYCMIIGVGQFSHGNLDDSPLTPLSYYVPHSDRAYVTKGFSSADEAVEMFSKTVGPYPYEKLALIVGATRFGGMENSGAIVFTSSLFTLDPAATMSTTFGIPRRIENLVAHEIAHQWFGDSVTESTWADLWLSEGFATYFAGLFLQRYDGEEAFQRYMKNAADRVLEFAKKNKTPIHDRDTENLLQLLNANNYQKGAWVLHTLRSRLGDDAFFRGVRLYYETHKNSTASTEDLRRAMEKASGRNLNSFFQRWIYESGHPKYEVSWKWMSKKRSVTVSLTQVQDGNPFLDPVPVVITTSAGKINAVITPTNKTSAHTVRLKEKPTTVEVDPLNTLLKEVTAK